ncbi:MAG: hypothetical protein LBB14_00325 [Puniceicoccales bacterium]|jgi:hypothetical protein|nr:hypothetical protein [Puniceicoccales bacterium]
MCDCCDNLGRSDWNELLATLISGGTDVAVGSWNIYQYNGGSSSIDRSAGITQIVGGCVTVVGALGKFLAKGYKKIECWAHWAAALGSVVALSGGALDAEKYANGGNDVDIVQAIITIVSTGATILTKTGMAIWACRSECKDGNVDPTPLNP